MFQKFASRFGAVIAVLFVTTGLALAQANSSNYATQGGSDWEVGGTLNVKTGGTLSFNGVAQTGVVRAGEATLSSGTIAVATGLTTVTGCTATIKGTSTPGVGTSVVTYGVSGGTVTFYGWKVTNSSTTTLIATAAADVVGWVCVGS